MCLSTTVSWTASSCREGMEEEEAASDGAAISASAAILGRFASVPDDRLVAAR